MKRLLSFMQRAYPTDPSRSVDFDGFRDQSRGAIGAGSDKLVSWTGLQLSRYCPSWWQPRHQFTKRMARTILQRVQRSFSGRCVQAVRLI